jgi:hypothetical protein
MTRLRILDFGFRILDYRQRHRRYRRPTAFDFAAPIQNPKSKIQNLMFWLALLAAAAAPTAAQAPDSTTGAPGMPAAPAAPAAPAPATPNPTAPAAPAASPAAAPAAEAKPAAKAGPAPIVVRVVPSYQNLGVDGSQESFYRYNRPPSGFFPGLIQVTHRAPAGYPLQELWWRNLGLSDQKGYLDVHMQHMPSFLRFWRNTADFYGDPLLPGFAFSNRQDNILLLRLRRLNPGRAVDLFLWDQYANIPALSSLQPFTNVHYHAAEYGLRSMLSLGGGQLYSRPRRLNYDDHTGLLPSSDTNWLASEYTHPIGSQASVSAAYERITTDVNGQGGTALWNVFRLQGAVQPASHLFLDAYFRQRGINQPFTVTPVENRDSLEGINLSAYPVPHTSVRAGMFRQDLQLLDPTLGTTTHPSWTGGSIQLRAAKPGIANLTVQYRDKGMNNPPGTTISALPNPETLFYTRDQAADARLDGFVGQRVNAYFLYGWRRRKNEERESRLSMKSATLGATAQATTRISVTAEFTQQRWSGDTAPFLAGEVTPPGGLSPALFYSNAHIFTGGLTYQIDNRSSANLNYNMANSTGGQSAREYLAILEYRRDVSRTFFYSVGYQYENFHDNTQGPKYKAFPILLQIGLRREFQ